jgi:hypothetical protein
MTVSTKSFHILQAVAGEPATENRPLLNRFLSTFVDCLFIVQMKRFQNASTGLSGRDRRWRWKILWDIIGKPVAEMSRMNSEAKLTTYWLRLQIIGRDEEKRNGRCTGK